MEPTNDNEYAHYNYKPSEEGILDILSNIEKAVLNEYLQKEDSKEGKLKVKYHTNSRATIQRYSLYCGEVLLGELAYGNVPMHTGINHVGTLINVVKLIDENNGFKGSTYFKAAFLSAHALN